MRLVLGARPLVAERFLNLPACHEPVPGSEAEPSRQRSKGRVALVAARVASGTQALGIAEAGPLRVRIPRNRGRSLEAVLLNTGGGVACGDRLCASLDAGAGSEVVLTSAAAEKIYRSDGAWAASSLTLTLAPGADVAWLPQETIVFDGARFRRCLDADLAEDSRLLAFEAVVFGRTARGEEVREGSFTDRWRIRRGGRLVLAEALRLTGPVSGLLDRPAVAAGARALATLVYVAPDAESRIEEARSLLRESSGQAGASAWEGLLVVRFLARDGAELRCDAVRFIQAFRGCAMPRVWQS